MTHSLIVDVHIFFGTCLLLIGQDQLRETYPTYSRNPVFGSHRILWIKQKQHMCGKFRPSELIVYAKVSAHMAILVLI